MEIDVKKEQKRVKQEMEEITAGVNKITGQEELLAKNKSELFKQLFKKQGELEYFDRVNGDKGDKSKKAD